MGPCDSYSYAFSAWSACSASCGGGKQYRSALCVSSLKAAPVARSLCPPLAPSMLVVDCAPQQCPSPYRWQVASSWGACSATCGGGVATRSVQCVDYVNGTVSSDPATDCPSVQNGVTIVPPESTRVCNTDPCLTYVFRYTACRMSVCV